LVACGGGVSRAREAGRAVEIAAARATADAIVAPIAEAAVAPHEPAPKVAWAERLAPLRFVDGYQGASETVRLYRDDGAFDEEAARRVDRLLDHAMIGEPPPLDRRLLRLVVKAADHVHADTVLVLSTWRASARPGSRHATSHAMDFQLAGVDAGKLARLLRTYARVGVGIYTHPRTRFVHLDVRDASFHWVDASPPGRVWREMGITDHAAAARDEAYDPAQDLPG
ncbi:MAG TPA: DUF882 domain-containing protein, partial [Minicystis sp.]|nr:DUF882 domain-containing protein [Minicystis sp.]